MVERQLGFGGLSAIYRAVNVERDKFVLKEAVIPENNNEALADKAVEMFKREAAILAKLDHPQIAKVYDYFVENNHHYMVLEYIRGTDLRHLVKESGPQPQGSVVRWAKSIAATLEYLHSQLPPVLHRDISPDNLILREDGTICLVDFGAANVFLGTATGTMVGKQSYMAPEQLRGKACIESDIYGLGCTIHFLLTGEDPMPLAVSNPRKSNAQINSELDKIVQQCTQFEVEARPRSASSLGSALRFVYV